MLGTFLHGDGTWVGRVKPVMAVLFGGWLQAAATGQSLADTTYADVAPILAQRCVICHSGQAPALGLRLDSFDAVLKGSNNGPVVRAGDPADSELIRRIKGISQPRMPLTGPPFLSDNEIAIFERWIAGGLRDGDAPAARPIERQERPGPGEVVTYRHIGPILVARCAKCHTDNGLMGPPPEGYRLTSYEATLEAADRARVIPGNPDASELLRRIRGQARPRMPFDGPPYLEPDEIQLIEDWIAQGARNAEGVPAALPTGARIRLHGTLGLGNTLDGLPLAVGPWTRIDKRPRAGDYVEVRGTVGERGTVSVERLRRR